MQAQDSNGRSIRGPEALESLRVPFAGTCWWCQTRPATTGEHKFKRTDLTRLMAQDEGDLLIWVDLEGNRMREVRGRSGVTRDRHGVVKFPKSMCEPCNNRRSKPFDTAYETYSEYVHQHPRLRRLPGLDFTEVFGVGWQEPTLNVARYYAKHFGCRMVSSGVPVPPDVRRFLDGETDMTHGHMALVTTDSVHRLRSGVSISPEFVEADKAITHLVRYVAVAYVGSIGVRYEWREEGIADGSQFFHYPTPLINPFVDDVAVFEGRTRRPGFLARVLQAVNRPR